MYKRFHKDVDNSYMKRLLIRCCYKEVIGVLRVCTTGFDKNLPCLPRVLSRFALYIRCSRGDSYAWGSGMPTVQYIHEYRGQTDTEMALRTCRKQQEPDVGPRAKRFRPRAPRLKFEGVYASRVMKDCSYPSVPMNHPAITQ